MVLTEVNQLSVDAALRLCVYLTQRGSIRLGQSRYLPPGTDADVPVPVTRC